MEREINLCYFRRKAALYFNLTVTKRDAFLDVRHFHRISSLPLLIKIFQSYCSSAIIESIRCNYIYLNIIKFRWNMYSNTYLFPSVISAFSFFILTAFTTFLLKALLIAGKFPYNCLRTTYLCNVILPVKCEELRTGRHVSPGQFN